MAKFRVQVRDYNGTSTVDVEAGSPDEARQKVRDAAESRDITVIIGKVKVLRESQNA